MCVFITAVPITKLFACVGGQCCSTFLEETTGTSAASLSESSCLLHESRTNIIVRMDLRSLVELAHDSAGRVNMREELDRPRRPPTGGARGFFLGVRALAKMGVRPSPTGH